MLSSQNSYSHGKQLFFPTPLPVIFQPYLCIRITWKKKKKKAMHTCRLHSKNYCFDWYRMRPRCLYFLKPLRLTLMNSRIEIAELSCPLYRFSQAHFTCQTWLLYHPPKGCFEITVTIKSRGLKGRGSRWFIRVWEKYENFYFLFSFFKNICF